MAAESRKITVEIDPTSGKVLRTDPGGASVREIPMENVTLAEKSGGAVIHHKIVYVPDYTVIHTKSNPECRWVYMNGRWIQVCT